MAFLTGQTEEQHRPQVADQLHLCAGCFQRQDVVLIEDGHGFQRVVVPGVFAGRFIGDGVQIDLHHAGLACQNMSAEAQLLGYGTKIISSPTIALNGEEQEAFRELLGIPDDQSAVAVLLIGKADTSSDADAVSAATTRKDTDEVVTKVAP